MPRRASAWLRADTLADLLHNIGAFRAANQLEGFLIACEADARGRTGFENRDYARLVAATPGCLTEGRQFARVLSDEFAGKVEYGAEAWRGLAPLRIGGEIMRTGPCDPSLLRIVQEMRESDRFKDTRQQWSLWRRHTFRLDSRRYKT